ncbi:alpha/beta fold hydrolase [Deinococcus roseus]|uniref:Alpha/beta hydrolase n=1 Tax=Deinococcus roseus TaxID=392414 RepID=A0ABQ2D3J4_9DEIO|nr:alpha/beta hydrolase [Deinococcus roseus]GGJ42694.1 alpha/beta hydrolase [Deinococcus roseus]
MKKTLQTLSLMLLGSFALAQTPVPTTVVLVHGAFADGSSWNEVSKVLQKQGVPVKVVANPLRGLTNDGEYVANVVRQIPGPVLLVGHSYGGPVITYAGTQAPNAKGLVFVASFGLDQGQNILESIQAFKPAPLNAALQEATFPNGAGTAGEFYVQQDKFHEVFAADVPQDISDAMGASQRPVAGLAFGEKLSIEPAWKKLPSWFLITTQDNAINPDAQRDAAKRIHAQTVEIAASHAVAVSHPTEVAQLILNALHSVNKE